MTTVLTFTLIFGQLCSHSRGNGVPITEALKDCQQISINLDLPSGVIDADLAFDIRGIRSSCARHGRQPELYGLL